MLDQLGEAIQAGAFSRAGRLGLGSWPGCNQVAACPLRLFLSGFRLFGVRHGILSRADRFRACLRVQPELQAGAPVPIRRCRLRACLGSSLTWRSNVNRVSHLSSVCASLDTKVRTGETKLRQTFAGLAAATLVLPAISAPALARDSGYYDGKVWRDSHGRLRCTRPNGTTGLIVGAAGGALIGHAVDTRG